jgi:hypothetical protein
MGGVQSFDRPDDDNIGACSAEQSDDCQWLDLLRQNAQRVSFPLVRLESVLAVHGSPVNYEPAPFRRPQFYNKIKTLPENP